MTGVRGTTLLEVLVAVGILGTALLAVVVGLSAWRGQFRRWTAARQCREVLVGVQELTPQVVCRAGSREVVRGTCTARLHPREDCTVLEVELNLRAPGVRTRYQVGVFLEDTR